MKSCCDCGAVKPLTEFYVHKKSGHAPDCKDCNRAKARER